jgi:L,D-transpeptidase ErfK/SrfK
MPVIEDEEPTACELARRAEDLVRRAEAVVESRPKVTVVDQPIKLGWINGEIFMDAHSTQAQSDQIEISGRFEPRLPGSVVDRVVAFAGEEAHRLDWSRIRQAVMERRGYPIRITR